MQVPKLKHPQGEFAGFIDMLNPPTKPPLEQVSIFPTITDIVYEMMPSLLSKYKTKIARIRNIAKQINIDEKQAKKHYKAAYNRFVHELNYKHYIRNKDWFKWFNSSEFEKYLEKQERERICRMKKAKADIDHRIAVGKEHIIKVSVNNTDIVQVLDNYVLATFKYHGLFSSYINMTIVTEHDVKVLIKNQCMQILKGNPETILGYDFSTETKENMLRLKCSKCNKNLNYNDVGLNKKFGNKIKDNYKCPKCLGLNEKQAISIMGYYRSSGCDMFV